MGELDKQNIFIMRPKYDVEDILGETIMDKLERLENRVDNIERNLEILGEEIAKLPGRFEVIAAMCLLVNFILMVFFVRG